MKYVAIGIGCLVAGLILAPATGGFLPGMVAAGCIGFVVLNFHKA